MKTPPRTRNVAVRHRVSAPRAALQREAGRALEIRSSLDNAQTIIDTTSVALAALDSRFNILSTNAAFQTMFRVSGTELLNKPFALPRQDPDAARRLRDLLRRLLRNEAVHDVAIEWAEPEGGRRHCRLDAWPMRRAGRRDLILLSFLDVTSQKEAERELRRSHDLLEERVQERTAQLTRTNRELRQTVARLARIERRLRESNAQFTSAMRHLPALSYLKDEAGRILFVNEYAKKAFGTPPKTLAGRTELPFWPAEVNAEIARREERIVRTGRPEELVLDLRAGGRDMTFHAVLFCIPHAEGALIGGIWTDVTESRRGQRRAAWLATAFDQVAEAALICGIEGQVLYTNAAFQDFLGPSGRAAGEGRLADLLGEPADAPLLRGIEDALRTGQERRFRMEKDRSGRTRDWDAIVTPVRDEAGRVAQAIVILRETTAQAAMERHLRRKQKTEALGALAGGIAHDFNNLLIPIIINTEIALHHLPEHDEIRHYLNQSLAAAERGKQLVKQIVTMCREEEKKLEPVHVLQVVKDTLGLLRSSFPSTIELRLHEQAWSDLVLGDPALLHQVLLNLGNNAAQAMQETGGTIDLEVADVRAGAEEAGRIHPDLKPGTYVRLSVRDTGPGIPEELLDRIFDPFFTTKRSGQGSGMGLAIVQGILRTLKGVITVRSHPGQGARFDVYLPLAPEAAAAQRPDFLSSLPRGTERILVVDDEEIVVRAEQTMLRHLGYRVTAARDPHEALEIFRVRPGGFDAVITDQGMPKLSGDGLARELLKIRPDLPIIICTGFDDVVDADSAKAMGIKGFLMKPFTIRELSEAIRRAVGTEKAAGR